MNKQEYAEYVAAVGKSLKGLEAVSSGLCSGCNECSEAYSLEYETAEDFAEAISNGDAFDEPSFSRSPCEVCGSGLGGDRYVAHAVEQRFEPHNVILHFDICGDCVYFIEYGRLDDTTMAEIEG